MGIGGISCFFQPVGPAFIIIHAVSEQGAVPGILIQEIRMVLIGSDIISVLPEAFVFPVIGIGIGFTGPGSLAFDAEVIVGVLADLAGACRGFMDALGELDGRRYACPFLFQDGQVLILIYVSLHSGIVLGQG